MVTDLDFDSLWTEGFIEEIEKRADATDTPPEDWRVGGRASKAWPNKEDHTWWMTNGPDMLRKWQAWWDQAKADGFTLWTTPSGVPAVELPVSVVLGGTMLKGYIDAVLVDPDGDLVCVDWKTGREPTYPGQLGFYKVAIEKTFKGVEVSYGAYYLARKGDLSHVYDLAIYDEHMVGDWLKKATAIQKQGLFIPNPSSLCGACGVRPYCRVMSNDPEKSASVPSF